MVGPRSVVVYNGAGDKCVGRVLRVVKHGTSEETRRQTRTMWLQPYSVAQDGAGVQLLVAKYSMQREEVPGGSATVLGCVRLLQVGHENKWHLHPADFDQQKMRGLGALRATAAQVAAARTSAAGAS